MKLDRLREIGKTDKVLLEWKHVQRSAKYGECATLSSKRKKCPDLIFIRIYNGQTTKQAMLFLCNEIVLIGL